MIQRVCSAAVSVRSEVISKIGKGLLLLVGFEEGDEMEDVIWLARKVVQLRIFDDENGVMNLSIQDVKGDLMLVSQFTLHAQVKKGNRPSYIRAARPEKATPLYEALKAEFESLLGTSVSSGVFGAEMQVSLMNDGPVTIWIDTKNKE